MIELNKKRIILTSGAVFLGRFVEKKLSMRVNVVFSDPILKTMTYVTWRI